MKRTNIFSKWISLVMLLSYVHIAYGQTVLTASHNTLTESEYILNDNLTITQTITVPENKTVTLDLNGFVLKGNFSKGGFVLHVKNGGKLTVKDSNPKSEQEGYLDENGLFVWPYVAGKTVFAVSGGMIHSQQYESQDTKGIYVEGECILENAKIMGCYSEQIGAAVTISSSGIFKMTGGEVSYNRSKSKGGAIYGEPAYANTSGSSINISGAKISNNYTVMDDRNVEDYGGGGIFGYNVILRNCIIASNDAPSFGGGIFVSGSEEHAQLLVEGCTIENNRAGIRGGGIFSKVNTIVRDCTIKENWAMTTETGDMEVNRGRGGGFCFSGKVETQLINTNVFDNVCMYYGGGGEIKSFAKLTMENSKIYNNQAILHGAGGLHVTADAHFIFESGEMFGNLAQTVGGGIHSSYDCKLDLIGGSIYNNIANGRGGGVHVNTGGNLELNGTNIYGNKAFLGYDYITCKITKGSDGKYTWNTPAKSSSDYVERTGYGGGVLIDAGTCEMKKGTLYNNYAQVGGGGIALVMINMNMDVKGEHFDDLEVVKFTLNPEGNEIVSIQNNKTDGDGAGVYLMENTMKAKLEGVTPNDYSDAKNKDAIEKTIKAIREGIPAAFIHGGSMTENIAKGDGGALFVFGNVTMTDGSITQNEANNGGGICITDGKVEITKGEISNNTAESYGGGLYVINEKTNEITLSGDGVFNNNTAKKAGGGMAVGGPVTFAFSGTLENNTAPNGGGIYLLPGTEKTGGAILNFNGGFIRNNTAVVDSSIKLDDQTAWQKSENEVKGVGGGVFLDDYTTLNFHLEKKDLGFYGNRATNAADDIFANGLGTTVDLPDVSEMELSDFPIPAENLFWAEDYYSRYENGEYENDVKYLSLLPEDKAPTFTEPAHNLRYRFALDNLKRAHIVQIPKNTFEGRYVCLALGWEIFYVNIIKRGLKAGESAIFHIYPATDENNMTGTPYLTTILTGTDDNGSMVYRTVTLTRGYWGVEENGWSYTYDTKSITPKIRQIIADDKIENEDDGFKFENTPKTAKTSLLHHEAKVKNIMGKKQE